MKTFKFLLTATVALGFAQQAFAQAYGPGVTTGTGVITSLPSLPAGSAAIGTVGVTALPSLPAGSAAIGSVTVSNLPGTQPVSGSVGVSSLPALPAGSNGIGSVTVSNFPGTQAVSGTVGVSALPALPAGSNAIGSVSVSALPALPAGANAIGSVTVSNFPATQAVSAASLPLPSGAATAANQATAITQLGNIPAPTAPGTSAATARGIQGVTGGISVQTTQQQNATMVQATTSCAATATQFLAADTTKVGRYAWNSSTATLYFGPSGVTTTSGQPVAPNTGWDFSKFSGPAYCIVATGTASLNTTQY